MKKIKYSYIALAIILTAGSCKQELIVTEPPAGPPAPTTPNKGTADFTKFVAVGNSFVAGVQGGALFTEGQKNSLPAIMAKQFATVGGGTFVQPSINATLGYNLFITPNPGSDNRVLGRLLLQNGATPDCTTGAIAPKPTPQKYPLGVVEAIPNPTINPAFLYTGGKATLNNFGIPAIVLGQALIGQTGNWAIAGTDPRFNPFYGRLAFPGNPGGSLMTDVANSGATFTMLWLGMDDYFLYAAFGGDPTKAPLTPPTGAPGAGFDTQFGSAFVTLANNPNFKGVVGNFPDIFVMPHFTSVSYNPIPLDAGTASAVSAGFAGYNAALDGLVANKLAFGISDALAAQIATRKVTFTASCTNRILMSDETLTNLSPYFDALKGAGAITQAQRDALAPYVQVRQTTSTDIIPLSTGSILGTLVGGDATKVYGVTVPAADQYVLIPTEITEIRNARDSYNNTITGIVNTYGASRTAIADVSGALTTLITNKAMVANGVTITPNINPPTGIYSEDGVHMNSRGYAFLANVFIGAINTKFNANVPLADLSLYSATGLPIN